MKRPYLPEFFASAALARRFARFCQIANMKVC